MIELILEASKSIEDGRDRMSVLSALGEEFGELSTEVRIAQDISNKEAGEDGVFGEAIDNILCSVDMIYIDNPNVHIYDIQEGIMKKLDKWKRNVRKV